MKKSTAKWFVLLFVCIAVFVTAVYFIIPKAASLTLPFRWNAVPVGQKQTIVRQYFGRPADTSVAFTDKWIAARKNGEYILQVHYAADSLADGYKLLFNYRLYFFHKQYVLKEQ
jgi:hypothetical protein